MTYNGDDHVFAREQLTIAELKDLFPSGFYKNENDLATHLTSALLLDELSSSGSDGIIDGEMAFWLKVLSTPTDEQTRLLKLEFKRNVYKAYCHLVKPVLDSRRQSVKHTVVFSRHVVQQDSVSVSDQEEETITRPKTIFERTTPHGRDEIVFNNSTMTEAEWAVIEACLNDTNPSSSTSQVVTQPLKRDDNSTVTCSHCPLTFANVKDKKEHLYSAHKSQFPYACHMCEHRSKTAAALRNHIQRLHTDQRFLCDACDYTTNQSSQLIKHQKTTHGKASLSCDQCLFTVEWGKVGALSKHMKLHHGMLGYQRCRYCSHSTNSKLDMRQHVSTTHMVEPQLTSGVNSYAGHRRPDWIARYWCSVCGSLYNKEAQGLAHIQVYHSGVDTAQLVPTQATKPGKLAFLCSVCRHTSEVKDELDTHLASHHDGTGLLVAEFTEDADYKQSREQCPYCDYSSVNKCGLKSHIRANHQNKTVYKCTKCDWVCWLRQALSNHMVRAHGATPKVVVKKPTSTATTAAATAVLSAAVQGLSQQDLVPEAIEETTIS